MKINPLKPITTKVAQLSPEALAEVERVTIRRAYQIYVDHEGFDGEVEPPTTVEQARYILKMMGELDS